MFFTHQVGCLFESEVTIFGLAFTNQRESQVTGKGGAHHIIIVGTSTQIYITQEGNTVLVDATDNDINVQWIHARTTIVEDACHPAGQCLGLHVDAIVAALILDHLLIDVALDGLYIRIITAAAQDDFVVDLEDTIDVLIPCQGTIGDEGVGCDNDTLIETNAQHR